MSAPLQFAAEFAAVSKSYPLGRSGRIVRSVDNLSLSISPGETLGLVGETGCGKTTVARLFMGLAKADSGAVRIGGTDIAGLRGAALMAMRRRAQIVFQDPFSALDPRMTVGASLDAPLTAHGLGSPAERRRKVEAMLGEAGLPASIAGRLPRDCSGGQLQRAVVARALLLEPQFLICDEPTSALDASVRAQILNLLMDLKTRRGLSILLISHDLRVVSYMSDRIAVMYLGQLVEVAETSALFAKPRHPYTQALIAASRLDRSQPPAERVEAASPRSGCRYLPRCALAEPACGAAMPELSERGGTGRVRCFRA